MRNRHTTLLKQIMTKIGWVYNEIFVCNILFFYVHCALPINSHLHDLYRKRKYSSVHFYVNCKLNVFQ